MASTDHGVGSGDEEVEGAEEHGDVVAGFVDHAEEAVARKGAQGETHELRSDEDGDFHGEKGDEHGADKRHGSDAGEKSGEQQQAAGGLEKPDEGAEEFRGGDADFRKASAAEIGGVEEFLDALEKENPTDHEADEEICGRGVGGEGAADHQARR